MIFTRQRHGGIVPPIWRKGGKNWAASVRNLPAERTFWPGYPKNEPAPNEYNELPVPFFCVPGTVVEFAADLGKDRLRWIGVVQLVNSTSVTIEKHPDLNSALALADPKAQAALPAATPYTPRKRWNGRRRYTPAPAPAPYKGPHPEPSPAPPGGWSDEQRKEALKAEIADLQDALDAKMEELARLNGEL